MEACIFLTRATRWRNGLGALLLLLSSQAFGEVETIGPFGSLNNTENPFTIPANQSQDLLNVDLTESGKSIKKRKGYGTALTLSNSTSPVHGVYNFYDSNGADVSLVFNDRDMNVSVSGGSPTVFFSTGTNGATYQCTDSAGFAYCANTSRDSIVKVNSSTYSLLSGFTSTGTMVTVTPERLVQAGFSSSPNLIWLSKSNDFTTWTVGGNPTDPIQFTITSPGSGVKHITYAHGRVYWFKDASFGYILEGATQSDWRVVTIDPRVGSLYNTSIYNEEVLYFQANDGHFYAYDGSNLAKLSKDIQETIAQTQGRTSNSWSQSSQSDFESGTLDQLNAAGGTIKINSTTSVRLDYSTSSVLRQCQTGSFTSPYYSSQQFVSTRALTLTSISIHLSEDGSPTRNPYLRLLNDSGNAPGTLISSVTIDATGVTSATSTLVSAVFTSSVSLSANTSYWFQLQDLQGSGGDLYWMAARSGQTGWYATCNTNNLYNSFFYWFKINEQVYQSSGIYASQVHNAPNISAWDQFSASKTDGEGSHSFYIRASTGVFYATATSPSWTAVSPGAIPSISTNPYFQVRDIFLQVSTPFLVSPTLESFTQNWFEGAASDKSYAIYFDNSNWWSVASGTGATTNNKILKFDLINPGWYIYDIGMGGMLVRSQSLYFGSVTAGTLYKFGDVDNDDGAAIEAYWKSKDFFGGDPFVDKDYTRMSSVWGAVSNSTATITYTIDGSSVTSYNVSLGSATSSFVQKNVNLPLGKTGRTINVQYGNNAADQPWEIFGGQVTFNPKPWKPQ